MECCFFILDHTLLWVSDESWRLSSKKNAHMHPQNLALVFCGVMDLHPQTSWGPMNSGPRIPDLINFKSFILHMKKLKSKDADLLKITELSWDRICLHTVAPRMNGTVCKKNAMAIDKEKRAFFGGNSVYYSVWHVNCCFVLFLIFRTVYGQYF